MLFVGFAERILRRTLVVRPEDEVIIVAVIIRRGAHSLQAIEARRADGRRRQPSIGVSAVRRIRLNLLRRRVVADLVGGGRIRLQEAERLFVAGGKAVVEDCSNLRANLLVTAGFLFNNGCKVHGIIDGETLAFRVRPIQGAYLVAELVEHHANDGIGRIGRRKLVGFGEQEALERIGSRIFQEVVIRSVHACI